MRILLADDHGLVREGLAMMLQALFPHAQVHQAVDWTDAAAQITTCFFDLALIDLLMPGQYLSWEDELSNLLCKTPSLNVCVMSGVGTHIHLRAAFELGARGFIHKTATLREFEQAILQVLQGKVYLPPQTWFVMNGNHDPASEITSRQLDVLRLLAEGRSNKDIADRLNVSESTIKRHFYNLFKQLKVKNRVEAIKFARQKGILTD